MKRIHDKKKSRAGEKLVAHVTGEQFSTLLKYLDFVIVLFHRPKTDPKTEKAKAALAELAERAREAGVSVVTCSSTDQV